MKIAVEDGWVSGGDVNTPGDNVIDDVVLAFVVTKDLIYKAYDTNADRLDITAAWVDVHRYLASRAGMMALAPSIIKRGTKVGEYSNKKD